MSNVTAFQKVKRQEISAVITRADGTVENLGVISFRDESATLTALWYLRHPKQLLHKVRKFFIGKQRTN